LELDEGVHLGYALACRVATDAGVRLLAIKGPTLAELGLRDPRSSLDVDVLVDPDGHDNFVAAMTHAGWSVSLPEGFTGQVLPSHSITLSSSMWPAEVDVHQYFPGFLQDERTVFEHLWRLRTRVTIAGQLIACPSRPASAIIALLHVLRAGDRRLSELHHLVGHLDAFLTDEERVELISLAEATGATGPLAPALALLPGIGDKKDETSTTISFEHRRWELLREASGARSVGWLVTFRDAAPREWPRILRRALFLSETELRVRYPSARPGWRGRVAMTLDRWWQGLRALPRAAHFLRDHRRGP
jgi:hypothetical protein